MKENTNCSVYEKIQELVLYLLKTDKIYCPPTGRPLIG